MKFKRSANVDLLFVLFTQDNTAKLLRSCGRNTEPSIPIRSNVSTHMRRHRRTPGSNRSDTPGFGPELTEHIQSGRRHDAGRTAALQGYARALGDAMGSSRVCWLQW